MNTFMCAVSRAFAALLLGLGIHAASAATIGGFQVNTESREEVRNFYNGLYPASHGVSLGWTGNYQAGNEGTVSAQFKDASVLRINFFRALAGVPAMITLDDTLSAKSQKAALMMSMRGTLSHFPGGGIDFPGDVPELWPFWSQDGYDAAGSANLFIGTTNLDPIQGAIDGYIADYGGGNERVGHRRWLLYPQSTTMGLGHVPGDDTLLTPGILPPEEPFTLRQANAVWVVDGDTFFNPRPQTRDGFVAWPPKGYTPYQLVYPRWSLSFAKADFSQANVTMTLNGQPLNITIEDRATLNTGENTIVWRHPDWEDFKPAPRPSADAVYQVSVTNVKVGNATTNFTYTVRMFDPSVPGPDTILTTLSGPAQPFVGKANAYAVTAPATATGVDVRAFERTALNFSDGAETGLGNWTATLPPGFSGISTSIRSSGAAAFWFGHLLNPLPITASLELPKTLLVRTNTPIRFMSRHGASREAQVARFQVSVDGGVSWKDHWTDAGNATAELRFSSILPDLSEYVGRAVRFRFAYTISPGQFISATSSSAGWFLDDVTISGVDELKNPVLTTLTGATEVSFVPAGTNALSLQARARIFNDYGLEWGPLLDVNPVAADPLAPANITRIQLAGANNVSIEFTGGSLGIQHRVESSTALGGSWQAEPAAVQPLGGGQFRAQVSAEGAARKFYRVRSF